MKKEDNIKALVFDVGGVLVLTHYKPHPIKGHLVPGVHHYIAKKLKIDLDSWFDSIDSIYADSIEGKVSEKKALNTISKNLNISPKKLEKILIKAYKKNFKQNKKLYKIAFKFKKQGYRIAILSDQWPFSSKALILKKYSKNFNPIIISCYVGSRKPNKKIYRLLLKKLKLPSNSVIFIDNRDWNLKPAKELGIKTILFKNNNQLIKDLKKLGVNLK